MDRSFSRMRLGPGSVIYLVVTSLLTITAFYTQANLLFWALGLVLGALVVAIVLLFVSLRGIEVQRLTPSRGVADEPLVLRYHLTNRSRLSCFGVELIETWARSRRGRAGPTDEPGPPRLAGRPHGWVLHIGPGQSIQAEAVCWPRRRGLLRFERIIVRSGFPFGIIRKDVVFVQKSEALIYPPLRRLNRQTALSLSSQDIGHGRHTDRGGGQDEFFGLRPYRPGDSYKLIDWKHSARTSNLVSREMAKSRPPRMMILLDLAAPYVQLTEVETFDRAAWAEAQEEAINLTAALIRETYLHDIHVGLAVQGAACPVLGIHHSHVHHQRLLDSLARLDLNGDSAKRITPSARPTVIIRPRKPEGDSPAETVDAEVIAMSGSIQSPTYQEVRFTEEKEERRGKADPSALDVGPV